MFRDVSVLRGLALGFVSRTVCGRMCRAVRYLTPAGTGGFGCGVSRWRLACTCGGTCPFAVVLATLDSAAVPTFLDLNKWLQVVPALFQ